MQLSAPLLVFLFSHTTEAAHSCVQHTPEVSVNGFDFAKQVEPDTSMIEARMRTKMRVPIRNMVTTMTRLS